ncbi:hypothetical protein BGZ65_006987 [Modicella reniformis]|uniref:Amidohydrolase-related domain-containing protein n=1 Tax=Modicella reniformis TaxID=1440133 RepID=A0A9P6SSP4_9FUNG|nr:hypothetical protein BGZ65_006987 [Modicella reniformis]
MSDYQRLPQQDPDLPGHRPEEKEPFYKKKRNILLAAIAIVLLATAFYVLGSAGEFSHHRVHLEQPGISLEHFSQGVAKCKAIHQEGKHQYPASETRTFNPRFVSGTAPTLFKNGTIFDGVSESFQGDLLVNGGIIVQLGGDIEAPEGTVVVDLKGHILTPGIVDMHSHIGLTSWPELDATEDSNEMTSPAAPFVRTIDGFNPSDLAREIVVSGGVTSALVLPGSSNVMGGEAFAFKLRKVDTLSVEDMLIEADVENKWRYMKMACGENPKKSFGDLGKMPSTRLGEGWILREQFSKATELKRAQDDWCNAAERLPRFGRHRLDEAFPEDLRYESLVGVLRDDVKLHIHCYETFDLEAMITAFHHALDAYRVPDILKRAYKNVPTVATFAGKFGYKKEAFQSSVDSPKILIDAGISVAMKSDHPVMNAQHLVYQAAMAHHYGLTELQALASVTSVPAKTIGQDHRIGKLAVGMDADLVIWERHPLSLGSHPLQVYIDGIPQIENVDPTQWSEQGEPLKFKNLPELTVSKDKDACTPGTNDAIFTGIKKIILDRSETYNRDGNLSVVIKNGEAVCTGECQQEIWRLLGDGEEIPAYDLGGEGVVLPALLSVGAPNLGLLEIPMESSTGDSSAGLKTPIQYAVDALKFGGLQLDEAYKAGVLISITAPSSSHVVQGVSVAFSTGAQDALSSQAVLKENVALHVKIGHESKSTLFPTISSQIQYLRSSLIKGLSDAFNPKDQFAMVARGKMPLIVEVHNRDEIVRLIQVKEELQHLGAWIKLGLLGATEAWTVAEHLAKADIGVILNPYHCTPNRWTAQHCLAGAPLTKETGLSVLHKAGVTVGLAAAEIEDVRQLSWIAAWARSDLGISEKDAVGLLSWNLAKIVGLTEQPKKASDLVFYNGSPFEFGAKVSAIMGGGKSGVQCNPRAL